MKRIVLDRIPNSRRSQLPNYADIDHPAFRQAAAAWDSAKASLEEAKKSLVQVEQELPNAHLEDARADERLRNEGKAKLKGRPATQAAEKAIADAAHEHRVAELTEQRTFNDLQSALDEHLPAWTASIESEVQALNDEWQEAVSQITAVHERRSRALTVRSMVVGSKGGAGAVGFRPSQIMDLKVASGQHNQTGYVQTGDVLAGPAALGVPKSVDVDTPQDDARAQRLDDER